MDWLSNLLGNPDWTNGINSLDFAVSYQFYCDDALRAKFTSGDSRQSHWHNRRDYRGNKASVDFDYVFINTNRADECKNHAVVEPQGDNISTLRGAPVRRGIKEKNKNDNGFGGYPKILTKAFI